jgi:uncharacterized membrane protein
MDLHPIIVHIPVAFLSIYAILEILTVMPKLKTSNTYFTIKAFILSIGFAGALLALATGDNAREVNRDTLTAVRSIIRVHDTYAGITGNIFGLLFVIYFTMAAIKFNFLKTARKIKFLESAGNFFIRNYFIVVILALLGLAAVSITGALGGAIVYGPAAKDPFITLVVKYFVK